MDCSAATGLYTKYELNQAQNLRCGSGSYCLNGVPTTCSPGFFMPAKGFWKYDGLLGYTDCLPCTLGHYCDIAGMNSPNDCAIGTYQDTAGQISCKPCTPGYLCTSLALIQPTGCTAGYYNSGAGCVICSASNYCPYSATGATTSETPAPLGYYSDVNGLDSPKPCNPGTYQDQTGQISCKSCTSGNYCPTYGASSQIQCPAGYYCLAGDTKPNSRPCTKGHYCPAGSSAEIDCPVNQYCENTQLSAPTGSCFPGFACYQRASIPTPDDGGVTGEMCQPGYYCTGNSAPVICSPGFYNDKYGASVVTDCLVCPPGFQCTASGIINGYASSCAAGVYCITDAAGVITTFPCDIGYYCPAGAEEKIKCLPGTYQDQTGQSVCKPCEQGYYCAYDSALGYVVRKICDNGFYCPANSEKEYPCPAGTYYSGASIFSSTSCIPCTDGSFCLFKGLSAVTGTCYD